MSKRARSRQGFTSIEVVIVILLLAVVAGSVAVAMQRTVGTFEQTTINGDVNARTARAMHRIVQELMGARAGNMVPIPGPPFGSDTIEFERLVDTAGGVPVWGPRRQIGLQLASGELDNGLDDNGNGLVDERSVVRIDNPGLPNQLTTILVNGVAEFLEGEFENAADDNGNGLRDERGLSFSVENGTLVIRTTFQRMGPDGRVITRTQQASILIRN